MNRKINEIGVLRAWVSWRIESLDHVIHYVLSKAAFHGGYQEIIFDILLQAGYYESESRKGMSDRSASITGLTVVTPGSDVLHGSFGNLVQ